MSKDNRHENIIQKQGGGGEEECFEKDKHVYDDEEEAVAQKKDEDEDEIAASRKDEDDDKEVDECKTPNSSDDKIPEITSCPGAPKKKAMMRLNSHKRKLSELYFFETTRSEEVDTLFRSNSDSFSTNNNTAAAASATEPLSFKKRRSRSA
ncbi:hypothetical protein HRI_002566700 [Hibiscus trionum]|uniref:Uncharacterized protein n=1 Tax=Hibiscus trionum TaxID=183268 RepID=A0A9W7I416_HIBTR|nr:hypothetical protein HRI_002566700 [Hibiscus trionum]